MCIQDFITNWPQSVAGSQLHYVARSVYEARKPRLGNLRGFTLRKSRDRVMGRRARRSRAQRGTARALTLLPTVTIPVVGLPSGFALTASCRVDVHSQAKPYLKANYKTHLVTLKVLGCRSVVCTLYLAFQYNYRPCSVKQARSQVARRVKIEPSRKGETQGGGRALPALVQTNIPCKT
jgi:hypothetical protein